MFSFLTKSIEHRALPYASPIFIKHRMLEFLENKENVFSDSKVALFLGASEVECCVDPSIVNPLLAEYGQDLHAVNIGMRNVEMEVYLAFVYKLTQYLKEKKQTLEAVYIKVPHTKLTGNYYRYSQRTAMKADQIAAVLSYADLWTGSSYFQSQIPEVLYYKSIFLGSSPYVYRLLFKNLLTENEILKTDDISNKYNSLWIDKNFLETPLWNLHRGGVYNWNLPYSKTFFEEALQEKQEPDVKSWSNQRLRACCDFNTLSVSEEQVSIFIDMVNLLKSVSKNVVLYHIKEQPEFLKFKTQKYDENLRYMFTLIKSGTGLSVVQPENMGLADSDYIDVLHLAPSGQRKFYRGLFAELKRNDMHQAH
ncbi:MAG: hypothetical protein ACM3MG_00815, partial [Bacillota bacterium]